MSKRFYKYKLLLDENMTPRQRFPRLNEHYDVKHVRDDLHQGGIEDEPVYRLAVAQGRILVTENWTDFLEHVGTEDDLGVIGIPPHWQPRQVDTKRTALLMKHNPAYFKSQVRRLGAEEDEKAA